MKKITLFVLLTLFMTHAAFSQGVVKDGVKKIYYENGALKFEGNFLGGKPEGIHKEYFKNGKLKSEMTYKNGVLAGPGKVYYANGNLMQEMVFQNGVVTGSSIKYDAAGNKEVELVFENGVNTIIRQFYENGNVKLETITKIEDSITKVTTRIYEKDGKLISEEDNSF